MSDTGFALQSGVLCNFWTSYITNCAQGQKRCLRFGADVFTGFGLLEIDRVEIDAKRAVGRVVRVCGRRDAGDGQGLLKVGIVQDEIVVTGDAGA